MHHPHRPQPSIARWDFPSTECGWPQHSPGVAPAAGRHRPPGRHPSEGSAGD